MPKPCEVNNMTNTTQRKVAEVFERLVELQCLSMAEIFSTSDGLCLSAVSVADIWRGEALRMSQTAGVCFWNAACFLMTGISMQCLTTIFVHMACLK